MNTQNRLINTPIGNILLQAKDNKIYSLKLSYRYENIVNDYSDILLEAEKQLKEYFLGKRKNFNIPILLEGTVFEKSVWQATRKITYGKTKTYQEIARDIGKEKAFRAVGNALGKNPLPIIIPCHRVVSKNGLGGFSAPIHIKHYLIEFERKTLLKFDSIKNY